MRAVLAGCAAVAMLFVIGACTGAEAGSGPTEFTLQPDLRYGGADSGVASFSQVRDVAVDGRGYLYVLDTQEATIRVFDTLGTVVRSIGRRGQGPAEFSAPSGLAFGPKGNLYVYDPRARRVTLFDTAGTLLETYVIPISSWGYLWQGGIDSAGRLLDRQSMLVDSARIAYVRRLDLVTLAADTLPYPRCEFEGPEPFRFPRGFMAVPYASGPMIWIDPSGGVWCANTARPVALRAPFGDTIPVDSVVSSAAPARVTDAERAEAITRVEDYKKQAGDAVLDYDLIPDTKQVLLGLDRDDAGRVWMRVRDSIGVVIHVFAPPPSGEWLAKVRLSEPPSDYFHMAARGGKLYAIAEDSIGAPIVLRYPVELGLP